MVKKKTREEHLTSTAKYVVPAATLAWAFTEIIIFAFPSLQPIAEPILTIMVVGINLAYVYITK